MIDHHPMTTLGDILPDIPRWVEARDLILHGNYQAFGFVCDPELSVVLREADGEVVFVIGKPSDAAILEALEGVTGDIVAGAEAMSWLTRLATDWVRQFAYLYAPPPKLTSEGWGDIRRVDLACVIPHLQDPELLEELEVAVARNEVFAGFLSEQPVAFCYAGSLTETLWDVAKVMQGGWRVS